MLFTTKAETSPIEEKSAAYGPSISFAEHLFNTGNGDLTAYATIQLYEQCMPFFNAVDMRATAFSEIPIRVFDKSKNEFIDNHPALELLEQPNADVSGMEFLYELSSFKDITGEAFMVATGQPTRPPLELMTISPQFTDFSQNSNKFGLLNIPNHVYLQSKYMNRQTFTAEEIEGRLRFLAPTQDKELWHVRSFNPRRSAGNYRGMTKAKPLWLEMQQYISGNRTNLSTLKRGTRLSMAWVNAGKEALTNVQWERMQAEAQKYSGDVNAGGTPILDGMDVKPIQQTNKDMEFGQLQSSMVARIANVYNIPLALLLDSVMTLSNLETAILHLYDLAVLPHASSLYKELTRFIMPRFPNSENLEFRYNEKDIPAVRTRLIETTKRQKDIGVNTVNELRENIGDEPLAADGDVVLVNSTQVPLDVAVDSARNPVQPTAAPVEEPEEPEERSAFEEFSSLMRKCKNEDGSRTYSDKFIIDTAIEKGLLDGN